MRCLSIQQPWAHLILTGQKCVENRTWKTAYRGPLAIHASKKHDDRAFYALQSMGFEATAVHSRDEWKRDLERGAIIGIVDLVEIVHPHAFIHLFGSWRDPAQFGWVLANPRLIPPIPMKGRLGLFEVEIPIEIVR